MATFGPKKSTISKQTVKLGAATNDSYSSRGADQRHKQSLVVLGKGGDHSANKAAASPPLDKSDLNNVQGNNIKIPYV